MTGAASAARFVRRDGLAAGVPGQPPQQRGISIFSPCSQNFNLDLK